MPQDTVGAPPLEVLLLFGIFSVAIGSDVLNSLLLAIAFLSDLLTSSGVMSNDVFDMCADMLRVAAAGAPIASFILEGDASSWSLRE